MVHSDSERPIRTYEANPDISPEMHDAALQLLLSRPPRDVKTLAMAGNKALFAASLRNPERPVEGFEAFLDALFRRNDVVVIVYPEDPADIGGYGELRVMLAKGTPTVLRAFQVPGKHRFSTGFLYYPSHEQAEIVAFSKGDLGVEVKPPRAPAP